MINQFNEFYDTNIKKLEDEYNFITKIQKLTIVMLCSIIILTIILLTVTNNINTLTLSIIFGIACLLFFCTPLLFASKFVTLEEKIFKMLLNEFFEDFKYSQESFGFLQMMNYMWPKGKHRFNRINLYNNSISIVESEISRNNDHQTSKVYFKGIIIKVILNHNENNNLIIDVNNKCTVIDEKEYKINKNKKLFSLEEIENKELLSGEMIKKVLEYKKQIDRNTSYFIYKNELYIAIEGATIIGNSNYKGLNKDELCNNLKMLKEYLYNIEKIFLF